MLAGKLALITGGSRGIGFMIAQGFVEAGAKVYITARKANEVQDAHQRLSALGECVAIPGDISTLAGCQALANFALRSPKVERRAASGNTSSRPPGPSRTVIVVAVGTWPGGGAGISRMADTLVWFPNLWASSNLTSTRDSDGTDRFPGSVVGVGVAAGAG